MHYKPIYYLLYKLQISFTLGLGQVAAVALVRAVTIKII
jgi:hypothetical protein